MRSQKEKITIIRLKASKDLRVISDSIKYRMDLVAIKLNKETNK